MHGYHPAERQSYAALLTNQEILEGVTSIPDIHKLMVRDAQPVRNTRDYVSRPEQRERIVRNGSR